MAEHIVDAALSSADAAHETRFYLGDQYVVFNYDADRVRDGVHPVAGLGLGSPFSPDGVGQSFDAALAGRKQFGGTGYHFRGLQYARFDLDALTGDPSLSDLAGWRLPAPVSQGVEAAFNGRAPTRDGKTYFFRGGQYARYDWGQDKPDDGYPKPISTMIGMPAFFAAGVDAAADGEGAFTTAGYLFREDQYVRFDWTADANGEPHASGGVRPILESWRGLVELLFAGKAKTQAQAWTKAAFEQTTNYLELLAGTAPFRFNQSVFDTALATHFHVAATAPTSEKATTVSRMQAGFSGVSTTLKESPARFRYRTDSEAVSLDHSDSPPAAAYVTPDGMISFTTAFARRGPMNRAASVLHEAVHVFDPESGKPTTHIPEWYVTDAAADALGLGHEPNHADLATRYDLMSTADALHNPSAYAAFAQHVAIGSDTRFGEGHHDQ
ncbi:MAG: hemopexin repeat-containing protein [Mycobacteriales bacterium]